MTWFTILGSNAVQMVMTRIIPKPFWEGTVLSLEGFVCSQAEVPVLMSLLTNYVNLDKVFQLSEIVFPYLNNGENANDLIITLQRCDTAWKILEAFLPAAPLRR